MSTITSSVKVTFYNANGTLNAGYSGSLADNRSSVSLLLNGNLEGVSSATLYVDSAVATSNDRKPFQCTLGEKTTVVQGLSSNKFEYPFVNNSSYSLRCRIVFNDDTQIDGKFSISGANPTPIYNYLYTTLLNEFSSATVTNPAQIQNGSSIFVNAPFDRTINTVDIRVPVKVKFTFELKEEGLDTDNLEALAQYSAIQSYSSTGTYELLENDLTNGYSYALTIEGVYADGYTIYENVTDFIPVIEAPVITLVSAYGAGLNNDGAGDSLISSVMDVTMETHINVTDGEKILFKLSQGGVTYYTYEVDAKTASDPVYYIVKSDLKATLNSNPALTTDEGGNAFYRFDVTAVRNYADVEKESNVYSEDFKLDITSLAAVSVVNQWTVLGLVDSVLALDSELTQAKFDLISETGYAAKFSKTAFFGTGIATGLYADLDTTSTQFKIEASVNGGTSFDPVTSLRMKQGSAASSAAVDRAQWMDLLDDTPITNASGLYDNIPWATAVVGTSQPPMYFLADCVQDASLVLRVSIVANIATLPDPTNSNTVNIMNKVDTPVAQNAYYSIAENKLYVVVNDSFASSNDDLTGVLFTSNLASPNDSLLVAKPAGNTTNVFMFEVASPELRGSTTPVVFQIAHVVDDENGGAVITGLQGPETSVVCYNAPTRANFTVSSVSLKTVSQDEVSSAQFNFSMNDDNNSYIYGLRVYFSADGVSSILVDEIVRAADSPREINLSGQSFYSSWTDRTVGTLTFAPLYNDNNADGLTVLREASSQTMGFTLRKVQTLPGVVPSLQGGIVEESTVLSLTSAPSGYSFVLTEGAEDLSEQVVSSSYTMAADTLTAGIEKILNIKTSVTLSAVSATTYFEGLSEETYVGPITTVTFTAASVDPSTMAISVLQGSNDDDLVTSFVAPVVSGNTGNQLNVETIKLGKVSSGVFSALTFVTDSVGTSTSALQTAAESNEHNIAAEPLSTLLELKVQVVAGIDYTVKVGSATAVDESSEPVALLGPSKAYRVAGPPAASSNGNNYTVVAGNITIPLTIDANGMNTEGLSNALAFITQASDFTDPSSDGVGATVFCLWSEHSPRTYVAGNDAVSSNTSDSKLASGETATTTPMDLVNGVNAIEVGTYSLTIGNLTSSDSSSISFPSTGFDTSKEIGVTFVSQTHRGYTYIPFTVSPPTI